MPDPTSLLEALRTSRFRFSTEADLQLGIERVLRAGGFRFEKEVVLDARSRIDFLVEGGTGIEVKVKGNVESLGTQVLRYLRCPTITGVVVVTTKATHRDMPSELEGKRIWVLYLSESVF